MEKQDGKLLESPLIITYPYAIWMIGQVEQTSVHVHGNPSSPKPCPASYHMASINVRIIVFIYPIYNY